MAMGNRKVRSEITKLVQKIAENGNGNRKVRSGIIKLVQKIADNGNGEP